MKSTMACFWREAHRRLVLPLASLVMALIGFAAMTAGEFDRSHLWPRVVTGLGLGLVYLGVSFSLTSLVVKNTALRRTALRASGHRLLACGLGHDTAPPCMAHPIIGRRPGKGLKAPCGSPSSSRDTLRRRFFMSVMLVLVIMVAVTFLIDIVNLGGRAASREHADFALVLEMALLRIPLFMVKILPFAMLFGTMLTYVWLTRTHELVVIRASGVSVWQFLLPALVITFILGIATITIFNPLASAMVSRFEQLENRYVRSQANILAVSPGNMWIREGNNTRQAVIHANRVSANGTVLEDVTILVFEENDRFVERYDARRAALREGHWKLEDVLVSRPDKTAESARTLEIPTELTPGRIQTAFASPETISFWDLPEFIEVMELAGFSALRHRIHWHAVLSIPLFSGIHGALCGDLLAAPDPPRKIWPLRCCRAGIRLSRLCRIRHLHGLRHVR